jgi:hypothetical protein
MVMSYGSVLPEQVGEGRSVKELLAAGRTEDSPLACCVFFEDYYNGDVLFLIRARGRETYRVISKG